MKQFSKWAVFTAVLACSSAAVLAQTTSTNSSATNAPAQVVASTNNIGNTVRPNFYKIIGLDYAELRKLPVAERQAKVKEAVNKRIAELEKQKKDNKISAQEQRDLSMLLRQKLAMERRAAASLHSTNAPGTNTPAVAAPKSKD